MKESSAFNRVNKVNLLCKSYHGKFNVKDDTDITVFS